MWAPFVQMKESQWDHAVDDETMEDPSLSNGGPAQSNDVIM